MPITVAVLLLLPAHYLGHLFYAKTSKLSLQVVGMREQVIAIAYLPHFPIWPFKAASQNTLAL